MRNSFSDAFYELAKSDQRIYLIAADIGAAAGVNKFREETPERFLNVGVAEAIMVGLSAGLAMRGCIPFAYTIAPFTIYRPFEQVRVDCCYQNLPVRLVGVGGGVNYSLLGSTHHAQEDIAVMGALPNMTILAPCDPRETREVTMATMSISGPVYLRLGKAGEPDLTANAPEPFSLGKIRLIKAGQTTALLTYGPITKMALDVATRLEREQGDSCAVYSVHSLKPLDGEGIARVLSTYDRVAVLEEHVPHGGLSSRVKEIAWDIAAPAKMRSFTLKDEFIHCYGTHWELLAAHGLHPDRIVRELIAM